MDGTGLLVILDMLGNTIAQLRQRVADLERELEAARQQIEKKG